MDLQPAFVSNIQSAYGKEGQIWLKNLPAHLKTLSEKWNFRFIQEMPNLSFNYVALVELRSRREVVILKTAPANSPIDVETHWLQCFKGNVPEVYDVDKKGHAFIMEYVRPGKSLKTLVQEGHDESATRVICKMIRELQKQKGHDLSKNPGLFKHLSEIAKDLSLLKGHAENSLLSKAETLFHELTMDRSKDVLLHGDLHHDNIMSHYMSWKVIDPHGYVGDPVAEVGVMIRNPLDCFPAVRSPSVVIETRLKILKEELGFDLQRIKAWAFCITMLSAAWNIPDFMSLAKKDLEIAAVIDQLSC
jgi:streptomycin 6-kinase